MSTQQAGNAEGACSPLSLEGLLSMVPLNSTPEALKALDLKKRKISSLPAQLKLFQQLRKLDVSVNGLKSCDTFSTLKQLTQLNLASNKIANLEPLSTLNLLVVLNVSNNELISLKGISGSKSSLKALIANDNRITLNLESISTLRELQVCETIVLSRNPLMKGRRDDDVRRKQPASGGDEEEREGESHPLDVFAELPQLRKLSLSECDITDLPKRWFLPLVQELRLANNALTHIPESVILRSAKHLDVSNNRLEDIVELRRCKYLTHLSVRGNPCTTTDEGASNANQTKTETSSWWSGSLKTHMILSRMFAHLVQVDGIAFTPLTKEVYLERRQQEAEEGDALNGDDACDAAIVSASKKGLSEGSKGKMTSASAEAKQAVREEAEAKDVVLDVNSADLAPAAAPRASVVRRERVVSQPQVLKHTAATGVTALELIKRRQQHESTAW